MRDPKLFCRCVLRDHRSTGLLIEPTLISIALMGLFALKGRKSLLRFVEYLRAYALVAASVLVFGWGEYCAR